MKRIYFHYSKWEDFHNGMYYLGSIKNEKKIVSKCKKLLKNPRLFLTTMKKVLKSLPNSSKQNLSNKSRNRQAWLGQASCSYFCKAPEWITKIAWRELTELQRKKANKTADKIILSWDKKHDH